jgi:hypothetical protein
VGYDRHQCCIMDLSDTSDVKNDQLGWQTYPKSARSSMH